MQEGKVPGNILKRSVINLIGRGPGIGVDCADMPTASEQVLSATAVGLSKKALMPGIAVYKGYSFILSIKSSTFLPVLALILIESGFVSNIFLYVKTFKSRFSMF